MTKFLQGYYLYNTALLLSYLVSRNVVPAEGSLQKKDGYIGVTREVEVWATFLVLAVAKYRTSSTLESFVSTFFLYAKAGLLITSYLLSPRLAAWYFVFIVIGQISVPRPYFSWGGIREFTPRILEEYLVEKPSTPSLLLCFYNPFSEDCVNYIPTFKSFVEEHGTDALHFGRMNASDWPELCERLKVDTSALTLVFFRHGELRKVYPEISAETGQAPPAVVDRQCALALIKAE